MDTKSTNKLELSFREYQANGQNLPINKMIGQYKVIKQIGKGAFGKIYLAVNQQGTHFALKLMDLMKIKQQPNPKVKIIRQRLIQSEPKCMQQCNSPNILKCFQIFQSDELKVLVLEYCNGKTLQEYIDSKKKIDQLQAVNILRQIINGIAELHDHRIVHRDLKSENIMEHEGVYKIIDLGFSKKLQISNELAEIKGTILGTVTTMAPEVLMRNQYGLKSDIWSLGVIFFQMVFGQYLYDSVSARNRLREIQEKSYFSPDKQLVFDGIKISKQANDFLYRVLQVKTETRMDWRELLEHPLIKQKPEEPICDRFLEKQPLRAPKNTEQGQDRFKQEQNIRNYEQERFKQERKQVHSQREIQQNPLKEEKLKKEQEQKKQKKIPLKSKINLDFHLQQPNQQVPKQPENDEKSKPRWQRGRFEEQKDKSQGMHPPPRQQRKWRNIQDSSIYTWIKMALLQCLKTQHIFTKVITPIQLNKYLDTNQRQVIQFMFLLCARCFNNMSPIRFRIEKGKEKKDKKMQHVKVENLYAQVKDLYMRVSQRFEDYCKKLTAAENGFFQMFFDFFKKRIFSQRFNEKSNFTTGVEVASEQIQGQKSGNSQIKYGDYNKSQQIKYTKQNYIPQMIAALKKIPNTDNIIKILQKYTQIMSVTITDLGDQSFKEYVNKLTD